MTRDPYEVRHTAAPRGWFHAPPRPVLSGPAVRCVWVCLARPDRQSFTAATIAKNRKIHGSEIQKSFDNGVPPGQQQLDSIRRAFPSENRPLSRRLVVSSGLFSPVGEKSPTCRARFLPGLGIHSV